MLKTWLFPDFYMPSLSRCGHTFCSSSSTAKRRRWTCFSVRTNSLSLSWGRLGTTRGPPDLISPLWNHGGIRQIGWLADRLDASATIKSPRLRVQCGLGRRPITESRPVRQSGPFQLEKWLGHSRSLYDVNCTDSFAAGLSKCLRRQQPWCWRSFSSFWSVFILNGFDDAIYLND